MDAYFYQQQYSYTSNCYHPGWQDYPNHSWNNNYQDQLYAPNLLYPPPQSQEPKLNLEKLLIEATEQMEEATEQMKMMINNQEDFAPELSCSSEFSYQPQSYEVLYQQPLPQPEEKQSNLEDIFTRFMESTEMSIKSNEESMRDLEIQREQLANIINSSFHETLPSNIEINFEEGKEQCETNTLENGDELYEVDGGKLKRLYSDGVNDCEVEYKRSKVWEEEENDENGQALDLNGIQKNPMVPVQQQFQNFEEYYRIDFVEVNNVDEYKFGGGFQSSEDAEEFKEKMKRRHDMTLFTIEPD